MKIFKIKHTDYENGLHTILFYNDNTPLYGSSANMGNFNFPQELNYLWYAYVTLLKKQRG